MLWWNFEGLTTSSLTLAAQRKTMNSIYITRSQTDRQTDRQTHRNTLHPSLVVYRYYEVVEGLVELRRSDDIPPFTGGLASTHEQWRLHHPVSINDCFYRHMYQFTRIAVIDFDEV